jgi:catechol 2,3-dioxygenase-like lactoylglutathione lyase family enzyme
VAAAYHRRVTLGALTYLYVGSADVETDLGFYRRALGGELVWRFHAFDADVAAVRLGPGPLLLLADHRPVPSTMPIWAVADLDATTTAIEAAGFEPDGAHVGTPDGPAYVFRDPSGNAVAVLRVDRPDALVASYADPANPRAVH